MPEAVGIRIYKIEAYRRSQREDVRSRDFVSQDEMASFSAEFLLAIKTAVYRDDLLRSLAARLIDLDDQGRAWGKVDYGTYGSINDIVNRQTGEVNYTTSAEDNVIYPLYYQIYFPPGESIGFLAIQSAGLRSCASLFKWAYRETFQRYSASVSNNFQQAFPRIAIKRLLS